MKKIIRNIKNIFVKKQPKYIYLLLFAIPLIACLPNRCDLDNDFYFLYPTGKYIIEHGFPHELLFTIHNSFLFIVQQWASAVIFYFIYRYFGRLGMILFIYLMYIIILYLSYKLCYIISKKRSVSSLISIIMGILLSTLFIRTRPQIFDYIIFLLEFIILEKYMREKDKKVLIFLPLLSFVTINIHASSFLLLFVFMLPYFINTFKFNILDITSEKHEKLPLILSSIAMLLAGLINPYKIEMITYIFRSFGDEYINKSIIEMMPPDITSISGFTVYISIFIILFIYFLSKNKNIEIRYFFLLIGTIFMSLLNLKSFSYFAIAGVFPLADYISPYFAEDEEFKITDKFKKNYIISLIILITIILASFIENYSNKTVGNVSSKKIVSYLVKEEKKENKKFKIYTNYYNGAYAEFNGLKVYIDPRAEAYLKKNNKKEDIYKEYYMLSYSDLDIESFLKKYNFDYIIVSDDERLYNSYLKHKKNKFYKKVYTEIEDIGNKKKEVNYLYKKIY